MSEKDISALINKYKQAQESGKHIYFDADEFNDLAEYYDSQDDLDTVQEIVDAGLSIHPKNTTLLVKKAKLLVYNGEYELALNLLDSLSEYDFDAFILEIECNLQLGEYEEAQQLSLEILKRETEDDNSVGIEVALSELGFLYVETDLYEQAITYLEKSLEYNSENVDVLSDLAYASEMKGDLDAAIKMNNKLLDIDPYIYDAWVNLGKLYSQKDDFSKAVEAFDFALTINDSDINVIKLKAHCLSLLGQVNDAIALFQDLLKLNPEDSTTYFLLSETYMTAGMYSEAMTYLNKYEEIEGKTLESAIKKAYLASQQGDTELADSIIAEINQEHEDSFDLNLLKGEIKLQQEKIDEAEQCFLKAYSINGENSHLVELLCTLYIQKEDYNKALEFAEELVDMESYDSNAKYRLALLYFELEDNGAFNSFLDEMTDEELLAFFNMIYNEGLKTEFNREELILLLQKARECRTLFKNLKY